MGLFKGVCSLTRFKAKGALQRREMFQEPVARAVQMGAKMVSPQILANMAWWGPKKGAA
jgi:hypothetical protein